MSTEAAAPPPVNAQALAINTEARLTIRRAMAMLAGQTFGGERDMYELLGYPLEIPPELYRVTYARGDIAGRIVDSFPDATWRETPTLKPLKADGKKTVDGSPFEKAFDKLAKDLNLWGIMHRLDTLTGLGHYGVLMLGLNGGEATEQPAVGKRYQLLYMQPHGETTAQVTNWDQEPRSPRYAQPIAYRLTTGVSWSGVGGGQRSIPVHWSRVIHIAERALEDKCIGSPRLERIFNKLIDLDKVMGGGAEVWWQNAAQLRAWMADADATFDPDTKADFEEQLEELNHGLRRDVRMKGMTVQNLASEAQSADAATIVDKLMDMIAGASGIPKRILIGSERGELSSEQDENNWAARIQERRKSHVTPNILRPFVDRLVAYGILPAPGANGYDVVWPESDTLGEAARADIAHKKAQATAAYVGTPGTDTVVAPEEFRRWLGEDVESEFELADPDDVPEPGTNPDGSPKEPGAAKLDDDPEAVAAFNRRLVLVDNAEPRSLYVCRKVLNWREIAKWAKAQGFPSTVGQDMHVTLANSETPVDWLKVSEPWSQKPGDLSGELDIAAGGPRIVERLGDKGAVVLSFQSSDLRWRHAAIKDAGAAWEFGDYTPHITLTYQAGTLDLAKVEPYTGKIELGPEIFEAIDDEYRAKLVENMKR